MFRKTCRIIMLGLVLSLMAGCTHQYSHATSIPAQTRMSQSIWLKAVPNSAKTVYVTFKNSSGLSSAYIYNHVLAHLRQKGYRLQRHPQYAHYILQVNLLRVLYVSEDIALAIGRSPYGTSLDTVPLYGDGKKGYYAGVADIKLVVKNLYAKGGRSVYKTRLVAFPEQPNLKSYYAKPAIAHAMVMRINAIFNDQDAT